MTPLFHPLIQVACAHPYFTPAALVVIALPVCENLLTRVPGPRCTNPLAGLNRAVVRSTALVQTPKGLQHCWYEAKQVQDLTLSPDLAVPGTLEY